MVIHDQPTVDADVVRVEFELRDPSSPFIGLSTVDGCELRLEEILPQRAETYRAIYSVRNVDVETVVERAETYDGVDARSIAGRTDGGLVVLTLPERSPAMFLAVEGALPREVTASGGVGRLTADLLPEARAADVVESFLDAYPTADLRSHRQESEFTPLFTHRELEQVIGDVMTDRQLETLRAAFDAGYYEWPRETSGEELADAMGVAPPTFAQHLRAAEQKLIALLFG